MTRVLLWSALVVLAATAAIAMNLALLGAATPARDPVGKQSARASFPHLRPSPGLKHPPLRRTPGREADD